MLHQWQNRPAILPPRRFIAAGECGGCRTWQEVFCERVEICKISNRLLVNKNKLYAMPLLLSCWLWLQPHLRPTEARSDPLESNDSRLAA